MGGGAGGRGRVRVRYWYCSGVPPPPQPSVDAFARESHRAPFVTALWVSVFGGGVNSQVASSHTLVRKPGPQCGVPSAGNTQRVQDQGPPQHTLHTYKASPVQGDASAPEAGPHDTRTSCHRKSPASSWSRFSLTPFSDRRSSSASSYRHGEQPPPNRKHKLESSTAVHHSLNRGGPTRARVRVTHAQEGGGEA